MASTIKLKNGTGVPLVGDLVQGEPAFDLTNKRLYTENAGGTVIEVGTNPSTLNVVGAATFGGNVNVASGTGTFSGVVVGGNGTDVVSNTGELALKASGANPVSFWTNGTTKMTLNASGNLGLGVAPSAWDANYRSIQIGTGGASVHGGTAGIAVFGEFGSNFYFDGVNQRYLTAGASSLINCSNGAIGFGVAAIGTAGGLVNGTGTFSTAMTLDASGNLAIGTTIVGGSASNRQITSVGSASSQLTLTGGGSFSTNVGTNGTVGYLEVTGANNLTLYTNSVERARLTSDGNLLVGTTSALSVAPKLAVESTNFVVGISGTNPTGELVRFYGNSRTVAGTISHLGSSVSYNTTSDQRLKENITDANDAGDKIDAIKVRQYDWKANGSHQDYGMVAQELMTVAPEAVYQPEDPKEMMGIDYSKLVPMLLKEIQSLRSRLDAAGL